MPFPKMKMLFLAPVAFSGGKPEFHFSRKCSTDPRIMPAPTIVFDLDGTLVDTAPDLIATLNTILGRAGLPPVDFAAARNMVGGGPRHMVERGLRAEGLIPVAAEVERMVGQFIEHYAA